MKKLAFVIPWYGEKIPGGAESALRGLVHHLHDAGVELEVLSTCVKEFSADWSKDYHKPGLTVEDGISIRRFKVRRRDGDDFDSINYKLINKQTISSLEEDIFLREMVNSPDLYEYIRDHQDEYELFVFTPYLFGTTYNGILACPEKSVMIPCFHDEGYAYMERFREAFGRVRGMIYLSEPEMSLANRLYSLDGTKQEVIGTGIDTGYEGDAEAFRKKYKIRDPFILYAGRKDEGKNIYTLLRYFSEYKKRRSRQGLKLVLIGGGEVGIPREDKADIIDLGFVSRKDKMDACAACELLCQPSKNESFSLVIMESWMAGRPVIVNGDCDVTKNFAVSSGGGLYFDNYYEFEGCVDYIIEHKDIATVMGENGRKYVLDHFDWSVIVDKTMLFLETCV